MTTSSTGTAVSEKTEERAGSYVRRSSQEVARLGVGHQPFSYPEWQREAPPATPAELAETEEFVRLRNLEREASIAAEAGVYVGGAGGAAPAK
jgi:hypothetical protein